MNYRTVLWFVLGGILIVRPAFAESSDEGISALRSSFMRIGQQEVTRSQVSPDQRRQLPNPYEMCLSLLKASPETLTQAIDGAVREGTVEERIGALEVYELAISPTERRLTRRPEYQAVLMDLLKHDDLSMVAYTGVIIALLSDYHSRDAVLAQLDAAARTSNPEVHERLLRSAGSMLHMDVPIYQQTAPLEKERILSDLEAWLNRNRDRIRFKKDGQPYLAGGEADAKPVELTPEDRNRIRKDPVCVLQLISAMMEGSEEVVALGTRCGEALLGSEGAKVLKEAQESAKTQESPSLDSQAAMASARGKYPTMDAVQLAIAYVAAYETDPKSRELARDTLEDLGSTEMSRILKGEPREVRRKAKELAGEVSKEDGEK